MAKADLMQNILPDCGNITAMLRQQGYPGVPTDYLFFIYAKQESV
jgi:uncharacterized damage-inducible protein DinB